MMLWMRVDSFHGANGHVALESSWRDCAKGHDPVESLLGAGDDVCRSCFSVAAIAAIAGSLSLSQVQALWPQVGRFL